MSTRRSRRNKFTNSRTHSLHTELLEPRMLLAADAGNSFEQGRLMLGQTEYLISERISSASDLDFFLIYAEAGNSISATVRAIFNGAPPDEEYQFDPIVGIFNPAGNLVDVNDDGGGTSVVPWTASLSVPVTETGIWGIAVTDYDDFEIDGNSSPESETPGRNTGKYSLRISGASRLQIEDADVTAAKDGTGVGDGRFGTYLPRVTLSNTFQVDMGFEIPSGLSLKYRFGASGPSGTVTGQGERYSFTTQMANVNPNDPDLRLELAYQGNTITTYDADVEFYKDLPITLELDSGQGFRDVANFRTIDGISEGNASFRVTINSDVNFISDYAGQVVGFESKPKSGAPIYHTATLMADRTATGSVSLTALRDVTKSGADYDFRLVGTRNLSASPFTASKSIMVISLPEWMEDFGITTKSYQNGQYEIRLRNDDFQFSVDPANLDPFGLMKSKPTKAAMVLELTVNASILKGGSAAEPTVTLTTANFSGMLHGKDLGQTDLAQKILLTSRLLKDTLDLNGNIRLQNQAPLELASQSFPDYNRSFSLPPGIVNGLSSGLLSLDGSFSVNATSSAVLADISVELQKTSSGIQFVRSGTYLDISASAKGVASVAADLNLLAIGGTRAAGLTVSGGVVAALATDIRIDAFGDVTSPSIQLNGSLSGATLGLSWQLLVEGDVLFGLFQTTLAEFKSNDVKKYQLLGSKDALGAVELGTGVGTDPPAPAPAAADFGGPVGQEAPRGLQGTLVFTELYPSTVSHVEVEVMVHSNTEELSLDEHRLNAVLVGTSGEVLLQSIDLSAFELLPTGSHLGHATNPTTLTFPVAAGTLQANDIYNLELRFYSDEGMGGETVAVQVLDVNVHSPQPSLLVTTSASPTDDGQIDFGPDTAMMDSAHVTLTNVGDGPLLLGVPTTVGESYQLIDAPQNEMLLQPGDSWELRIKLLDPTAPSAGQLIITSDDPLTPLQTLLLNYEPTQPVDVIGPSVVGVSLRGSSWEAGRSSIMANGETISELDVDQVVISFSEPVLVTDDSLFIRGVGTAALGIADFAYEPATQTATWTFSSPLGANAYGMDWTILPTDIADNALVDAVLPDFVIVQAPATGEINRFPQIVPMDDQVALEGDVFRLTVLATDANLGDTLTYSLVSGPAGAVIDSGTGEIAFDVPTGRGVTHYAFTVAVSDDGPGMLQDRASFELIASEPNLPPAIAPVPPVTVRQGELLLTAVEASDPNGVLDRLVYSLVAGPSGASVHPETGRVLWSIGANTAPGSYEIQIGVADTFTSSADPPAIDATITLVVQVEERNISPQLNAPDAAQSTEGVELLAMFTGSDANTYQQLTFSLAADAPAHASIDPATGQFRWIPDEMQGPGEYLIEVIVSDGMSSTSTLWPVTVSESNASPRFDAIIDQAVAIGQEYRFSPNAIDDDVPANTLTYTLHDGAPNGMSIDPYTGELLWTPLAGSEGTYNISVSVADDGDEPLMATIEFTLTVGNEVDPPELFVFFPNDVSGARIVSLLEVVGVITDESEIAVLRVAFDGEDAFSGEDILSLIDVEDEFAISTDLLQELAGGEIAEGEHSLHFYTVDEHGNATTYEVSFLVDYTPPTIIAELDPLSDDGTVGDSTTSLGTVSIVGVTEPWSRITLRPIAANGMAHQARADEAGAFRIDDVDLEYGQNQFSIAVIDAANNSGDPVELVLHRVSLDGRSSADAVGYFAEVVAPTFEDIQETGTFLFNEPNGEVSLSTAELSGFTFQMYGVTYDTFFVNGNGVLTLGDTSFTSFYPDSYDFTIDSVQTTIAPLWDRMDVSTGQVLYQAFGEPVASRLIIQWDEVTSQSTEAVVTFQVVLDAGTGSIQFNYADSGDEANLDAAAASGTVGIKFAGDQSQMNAVLRLASDSGPNQFVGSGLSTRISPPTEDTLPPAITAHIADEFGYPVTIVKDPYLRGRVADISPTAVYLAFGEGAEFIDITQDVVNGAWELSPERLQELHGGPFADGRHTVLLQAVDDSDQASPVIELTFDVDGIPPAPPTIGLATESDTGAIGDGRTTQQVVVLVGTTEPFATVIVNDGLAYGYADSSGNFEVFGVPLSLGENEFLVTAVDQLDNQSEPSLLTVFRDPRTSSNLDNFGYVADVVEPVFVDISQTGTPTLQGEDDAVYHLTSAELGEFNFSFYGNSYDELYVSSNGLVTFGGANSSYQNGELYTLPEEAAIAVLWTDLYVSGTDLSAVYFQVIESPQGQLLILQWHEVAFLGENESITFQVVFNSSDDSIQVNYLDLSGDGAGNDDGAQATVGIKDAGNQFDSGYFLQLINYDGPNEFVGTGLSTRFSIAQPIEGDFNTDRQLNCLDANLLSIAIASGSTSPMYDMNSDATINFSDMLVWLNVAGLQNGFATGYLAGDANLDGSVDATDFSILQNALFTLTPGWCHGDVNVSGAVDVADFNQWNMHKFTEATPAASALSTNRRLPRAPLSDDGSQVSSALHFEANHEVPESNLTTVRPRSTAVDYFADGAQRSASDVSQRGNRQLRDLLFSKRIDHSRFHLSRADFAETERIVSEAIKVRDRFAWRSEIIDAVVVDW